MSNIIAYILPSGEIFFTEDLNDGNIPSLDKLALPAPTISMDNATVQYNYNKLSTNSVTITGNRSSGYSKLMSTISWGTLIGESITGSLADFHEKGWRRMSIYSSGQVILPTADPNSVYRSSGERSSDDYSNSKYNYAIVSAETFILSDNRNLSYVLNPVIAEGCPFPELEEIVKVAETSELAE